MTTPSINTEQTVSGYVAEVKDLTDGLLHVEEQSISLRSEWARLKLEPRYAHHWRRDEPASQIAFRQACLLLKYAIREMSPERREELLSKCFSAMETFPHEHFDEVPSLSPDVRRLARLARFAHYPDAPPDALRILLRVLGELASDDNIEADRFSQFARSFVQRPLAVEVARRRQATRERRCPNLAVAS